MAATIRRYNHTLQRFMSGANASGDTYKLMLCSAATFDATDTTLADVTKTEISGNGYPAGGITLSNWAATTVSTNGAKVDADDATVTASGGPIAAQYGIIYNDTDADDPPLYYVDFGAVITASDTVPWVGQWNASGIDVITSTAG